MNKKHLHNEQLGYEVPEGYFESSKKDMLSFLVVLLLYTQLSLLRKI